MTRAEAIAARVIRRLGYLAHQLTEWCEETDRRLSGLPPHSTYCESNWNSSADCDCGADEFGPPDTKETETP
jgi:hypothetical protein